MVKDRTKLISKSRIIVRSMIWLSLPNVIKDTILHDAMERDITTSRRAALLEILWNERYLTRSQLIARVELQLGKNSFGISAWQDTFYRDMCIVKNASLMIYNSPDHWVALAHEIGHSS
jgi:hypothetical protein